MVRHILITGARGAGKSTLVKRLLQESRRPLAGFVTRRLEPDETGFHPIYIHPAADSALTVSEQNLIGTCNSRKHLTNLDVFNTLGVQYLQAGPHSLIVMDELGFMEAKAAQFCSAVLRALDGDVPVIAVVKARDDIAFLNQLRAHPNADVFTLTAENRESVFRTLQPRIHGWNDELRWAE